MKKILCAISTISTSIRSWTANHASGAKAIAILRPDIFSELQQRAVPMRIIAQDRRRIIVTNDIKK
jgi:hypothetical protein